MNESKFIINPNHLIAESIEKYMGYALTNTLSKIADSHICHYINSGIVKITHGDKVKKLLIQDRNGKKYNIGGVFTNETIQPLILIESKYIRYTKHNRDKASWICTAHSAVRRRYQSIRSSIAVLAGSWSQSSLAMMKSNDINLFLIPFPLICEILARQGVNFTWEEKDKDRATAAWEKYSALSEAQKNAVGEQMVASIAEKLAELIGNILDDSAPREVEKITVEIISNFGEIKAFEFESVQDAMNFLEQDGLAQSFLTANSATLFDEPPAAPPKK